MATGRPSVGHWAFAAWPRGVRGMAAWPRGVHWMAAGRLQDGHRAQAGMATGRSWDAYAAGWPQPGGVRGMAAGRSLDGRGAFAGWPRGVRRMAAGHCQLQIQIARQATTHAQVCHENSP